MRGAERFEIFAFRVGLRAHDDLQGRLSARAFSRPPCMPCSFVGDSDGDCVNARRRNPATRNFAYFTLIRPRGLDCDFDTFVGDPEISIFPMPAISASTDSVA